MRASKDQTVRGVVVLMVVVVVLLVPLISIAQNRIARGSTEGFNLAEVFAYSRGLHGAKLGESRYDSKASMTVADIHFEMSRSNYSRAPVVALGSRTEASWRLDSADSGTRSGDPEATGSLSSVSMGLDQAAPVNRSEARQQRVFQPASVPHYSFVKFSAYRQSPHTFFVTGITSYVAKAFDKDRIAHSCEWHPAAGGGDLLTNRSDLNSAVPVQGTQTDVIYVKGDDNHGTYCPAIINCTFAAPVGADRRGGLLVIRISTGYDRYHSNLPVVAMEELPGEVDAIMTPPESLPFKYAFCGAPLHGEVRADWLLQWMTYHHYLSEGQAHFFFYNLGGISEQDKATFARFVGAGLVSVTDLLDASVLADYPTWYFHQVLLINDCLHRSRFIAERVFFFDYDEFLQIPTPDTLAKVMSRYKEAPWISFGNIYANTLDCRKPNNASAELPVERMLWRRSEPECRSKGNETNPLVCIGPCGRRKYVVNPRKTFVAGVHWALVPETGLDVSTDEAHMLHYRSAPLLNKKLCIANIDLGGEQERMVLNRGWIRDESVSILYSKAKDFPVRSLNVNPPQPPP